MLFCKITSCSNFFKSAGQSVFAATEQSQIIWLCLESCAFVFRSCRICFSWVIKVVRVCHENTLAIRAQNNHNAETERDILLIIFS